MELGESFFNIEETLFFSDLLINALLICLKEKCFLTKCFKH